MHLAIARKHLVHALKPTFSYCNLGVSAGVGVCFKVCKFSTSCQPSLDVGDSSAGEVQEESRIKKSDSVREVIEEKKEELVIKTQLAERVKPHSKQDQGEALKHSPLKVVVRGCVRRWFKENLRNAEQGESDAQLIVGQMISHGYGVPKDVRKGEEWIRRAPRRQKESLGKKRSGDEELYFM